MEHVRSFTSFPSLDDIRAHLANNDIDHPTLQKSELYSSKADAKMIDESLRRSQFRIFKDDAMFGYVDKVVQWLNESDTAFHYQLRRDNITETRYDAGGHFLKHKDFLSITSNLIEELTLILCVTPKELGSVQGGETLIYPYASEKGKAFDTTTPGNGLLFRKDLEHAGGVVKNGEKHILTANIIATRMQISDQVLFVTFPAATEMEESKQVSQGSILEKIANQDSSYALPVDCLKGSMLEAHVRFFNRKYEQDDEEPPTIVAYHCSDFTYEEFGTVAKILLSSYFEENEIIKHAAAIDFFGPFAVGKLLVNLAVEQNEENEATEKNCKRFVQPTNVKDANAAKKTKPEAPGKEGGEGGADFGVIVCENESRTKVVYEVAQALGFTAYVPFKMVFCQGIFLHGSYDEYVRIPVTPTGLVVGDYNHIFALQNVGGRRAVGACTIEDYHKKHNYFSQPNPPGWNSEKGTLFAPRGEEEDSYEDGYEYGYYAELNEQVEEFRGGARGLGLKLALGSDKDARKKLSEYVLANPNSEYYNGDAEPSNFTPLLNCLDSPDKSVSQNIAGGLFHRDCSGKATFSEEEAEAASDYIASMNLDARVKAAVQKKRFELPQEMVQKDDYYCNESTYSNLSLLFVTGLIRLDSTVDATDTAVTVSDKDFDAWPTRKHREAVLKAVGNTIVRNYDIYEDPFYYVGEDGSDEGDSDY